MLTTHPPTPLLQRADFPAPSIVVSLDSSGYASWRCVLCHPALRSIASSVLYGCDYRPQTLYRLLQLLNAASGEVHGYVDTADNPKTIIYVPPHGEKGEATSSGACTNALTWAAAVTAAVVAVALW